MDFKEKIIETSEVFKGNFLKVDHLEVELPDGNIASRDVVRHPGAVAILAFLDEENILLVKQYRVALERVILEIPAGKLEKGEDPLEAAKRELEEETGYKAKELNYLGSIATGAGFTDELIHIYKGTNLYKGVKGGDDDEFIEVTPFSIANIKEMIKTGEIIDVKTIASLMYL